MELAEKNFVSIKFTVFITFKKLPKVTYTCINNFNKQPPMNNAKEYDLNYAILVPY